LAGRCVLGSIFAADGSAIHGACCGTVALYAFTPRLAHQQSLGLGRPKSQAAVNMTSNAMLPVRGSVARTRPGRM